MKGLRKVSYVLFSLCVFTASVTLGVKIEFESLNDFREKMVNIQQYPQTSEQPDYTVDLTVAKPVEMEDLEPFFEEIKKIKGHVETLKVTKSPAFIANFLISAIQEEGGFQKLTTLDLSANSAFLPLTFNGLDDFLATVSAVKTLVLSENNLSETMDFAFERILSSEKNNLQILDVSQTNPTTQTLSSIIHPLMCVQRRFPLSLILDNNDSLGEEHISLIQSLISTTPSSSRRLEKLSLRNCKNIPNESLAEVVKAYLLQGSCSNLFFDIGDEAKESLFNKVNSTLEVIVRKLSPQKAVESFERLQTLSDDNPELKNSLKDVKEGEVLRQIDAFLDGLLVSMSSEGEKGKNIGTREIKDKVLELKEYFTNLF